MPKGVGPDKELVSQYREKSSSIMSKTEPKSLSNIICDADSPIRRLADEARARVSLGDHIRAALAPDLAGAIAHCSLDGEGTLVVRTSGPEWASRLRFESERLLSLCREVHPQAQRVQVKVSRLNER